jgi:hypothetical protein
VAASADAVRVAAAVRAAAAAVPALAGLR